MKTLIKYSILSFICLISTGFLSLNAQDFYKFGDIEYTDNTPPEWTHDQLEVNKAVDRILTASGNYDGEAIAEMATADANMGIVKMKDGKWITETILISDFLESIKTGEKIPYYKRVTDSTIRVSDGNVAIVKADAVLFRFGMPVSYEMDNFTFLKQEGIWKLVNMSFTTTSAPEHKKRFDVKAFADGYNQAWCSQKPEFVAQFFAEDGSLAVNDGEPAVGRKAIAEVVSGFMTAFPDMVLTCDAVNITDNGTEFYWTFTGTNSGSGGTGKKVKFSGMELWQFSDDGRIKISDGHFDTAEYNEQVENGVKE